MKRLYENQVTAISFALDEILLRHKRASRTLAKISVQNPKWGSRDRNLFYDFTYAILRWKRLLSYWAGLTEEDHVPIAWIAMWAKKQEIGLPETKDFEGYVKTKISTPESPEILNSYPTWLYHKGEKELGDLWQLEIKALNQKAAVSLRINTLKTTKDRVSKDLKEKYHIENHSFRTFPDALVLEKGRKLDKQPLFKKGWFEIQDAHSQLIAPFTKVKPDSKVIDFCAGAGGKTLHLAALMKNQGEILALDVEKNKLAELRKRAKRNGATIIETLQTGYKTDYSPLHSWADTVLVDAPCSGLGTLKRNPEIKWNISPQRLDRLVDLQQELLQQAAHLVKIGGQLVYATCSILQSENEQQIKNFLATHPQFVCEEKSRVSPVNNHFDGFFMARLTRKKAIASKTVNNS